MSLSSTTNRISYVGDGSSATFSFPYYFFTQADLKVYLYDTISGSSILQVLNTNYTISGAVNAQGLYSSGANVVMASSIVSSTDIVIVRAPTETQNFILQQNAIIPSAALTQQLDYLTLLIQRQNDRHKFAVRLPDGYAGPFDPSIPSGLAQFAGQALTMNGSSTGWTFGNVGVGYIPNTLIYSATGSSVTSLPGGAPGLVLQSNGSSAPTWAAISLSGSSVSGNLSLSNGGTGGLTPQTWGVVFASSATQLATTNPSPVGLALISNASSAPSFQQLNFATAGSGFVAIANGGTGGNTYVSGSGALQISSYVSGSGALQIGNNLIDVANTTTAFKNISPMTTTGDIIIYGSNATQVRLAAGSSGFALIGQGATTQPIWQAVPAASSALLIQNNLSDVASKPSAFKNLSPTTTWGDIIYAGSGNIGTALVAGSTGQVLQTNGLGAAPSWATFTQSPLGVVTKTANYNATTADQVILCNSGAMTINTYSATGNSGRTIQIKKIDAGAGIISIVGSAATIDGSSLVLISQYESYNIVCDGTNWQVQNYTFPRAGFSAVNCSGVITGALSTPGWLFKEHDTAGILAASTGIATVNKAGRWQINAGMTHAHTAVANDAVVLEIRKNLATRIALSEHTVALNDTTRCPSVSNIHLLALNDTIEARTLNQNTSPSYLTGTSQWFSMTYLGQ